MTRDLEYARQMLDVSRAVVANLLSDYGPEHPRVRDAKESAAGWRREVERLERDEEARFASLTAGEQHGIVAENRAAGGCAQKPADGDSRTSVLHGSPAVSDVPAEEGQA